MDIRARPPSTQCGSRASSRTSDGTTQRSPRPYTRWGRTTAPPAASTIRSPTSRVTLVTDSGSSASSPSTAPRCAPSR